MDRASLAALFLSVCGALALTRLPVFAWADAAPDHAKRRVSTLDGLRGFVALAVVIHHGMMYQRYLSTERWELFTPFNTMLGQGGVALFFMLTGYLFWRRLVLARGRIDWLQLYVGRVFRIGPVFLLTAGIAIAVSLYCGRDTHSGLRALFEQISSYLLIGMAVAESVRGFDTNLLLAGVTWTLQYEWIFYACLPVLALLTRARHLHVMIAAILFVGSLITVWRGLPLGTVNENPALVCMFAAGGLTASLQTVGIVPHARDPVSSMFAIALLAYALFGFTSTADPAAIMVLAALFYLVATGCSLFGALHTRSAHRLGHISYGIYLMQGLALAAVLRPARQLSLASSISHVLLVVVASILVVFMALAAHRWVELPGIRLGDRVARWAAMQRDAFVQGIPAGGGRPSRE